MSLNSFYTIDQLRTSVEHHLFAQKASIEVVKRKSQVLLGLLNKYNEDLSLQDNIYQYLSGVSKRSYDSQCGYLKQWVFEEGIDCNFEINYKDIPRNYMTIETLNEKLNKLYEDPSTISRNVIFYLVYARLYAYLIWIGLSNKEIKSLRKGDYDIDNKVLYIGDDNGNVRTIDLKLPYYDDISEILHDELCRNISSRKFVDKDFFYNGSVICIKMYDNSYDTHGKEIGCYNDYDSLFRLLNDDIGNNNALVANVRRTLAPIIKRVSDIEISGLFYRVTKRAIAMKKNVTKYNFNIILGFFGYGTNRRGLFTEYLIYKEQMLDK
ncbi:MAG: hypothetical protein ACLRM7_01245 [Ruminococcus sp.]|jgi:hypothetical protein|nr:MAG TPA: hypothetical protein [Caudoviricetes sp.]